MIDSSNSFPPLNTFPAPQRRSRGTARREEPTGRGGSPAPLAQSPRGGAGGHPDADDGPENRGGENLPGAENQGSRTAHRPDDRGIPQAGNGDGKTKKRTHPCPGRREGGQRKTPELPEPNVDRVDFHNSVLLAGNARPREQYL